jgi:hypothetical protein
MVSSGERRLDVKGKRRNSARQAQCSRTSRVRAKTYSRVGGGYIRENQIVRQNRPYAREKAILEASEILSGRCARCSPKRLCPILCPPYIRIGH